ncbi:hypothetical protein Tco_0951133 [Tanacetum coccineum]|uniref:Uncharacterized protein n=1 Tax=Tanacetum coccineum TaxID=301880 RepID=A0ABQ5DW04_9ASTR
MPHPDTNNTYTKPPSENQILEFINTLGYDEDHETKMIIVSNIFATRLHQPWRAILSVLNRSESKFGMEIPNKMINDAIKKLAGYKFYMAKKMVSGNAKIVDEPEEQHQAVIGEESSAAHNKYYDLSYTNSDATLYSSSSDKPEEIANETDDADESDMDLSDDNADEDDDDTGYGVFMHNKSTTTPNSTYLSLTITSSSLDFIYILLDETPTNELMDFMNHQVYTDAQKSLVVYNLEGNPKLTSYISGTSLVTLGTHVDVLAIKTLLQEMFPDENTHHLSSPPATKMSYPTTYPQLSSLQAKAKKLMQKAKTNMRKINFKKAVVEKFREYDQKLEALTNFNVFEAFEKAVEVKVLTEIKKLLPTHIPKVVANYVRHSLNTSVLEVMKNNQINLFTQSSTSTNDLLEMDLKLKLLTDKLNEIHTTYQQLYDTLYESITLDQDVLNAQDAKPSFHKRSHDN